ncbi:hypothetical protein [Nocardia ignorata]|uniref:Uncharacterized protein n=1 Tax=Nocardia ignorata TaxID=145285 RepID=A0A4R6P0R0_NOCIG|nr:hypothetical protein [Nocardia ignorata]TDP29862.1 hypothetical protein DFR75_112131 [Nocardia ignorata]
MGSAPSADVYFGYDLPEYEYDYDTDTTAEPQWMQDGEDWEDELARLLGWVEVPFPTDYPRDDDIAIWSLPREAREAVQATIRAREKAYEESSPEYQAYAASREQRAELLASIPVELDSQGYDRDIHAVRIKASVQHVYGWSATRLNPLVEKPEWREQLTRFVEVLGLDVGDTEPGWHLNCSYG